MSANINDIIKQTMLGDFKKAASNLKELYVEKNFEQEDVNAIINFLDTILNDQESSNDEVPTTNHMQKSFRYAIEKYNEYSK